MKTMNSVAAQDLKPGDRFRERGIAGLLTVESVIDGSLPSIVMVTVRDERGGSYVMNLYRVNRRLLETER
jgi:hypothetical protein